jgi:hypothetical protein
MSFWIQNNDKVTKKWKIVHNFLYLLWAVSMILRFIIKYRDNKNNTVSDLQNTVWTIWIVSAFFILTLNLIHWIKPKWFENKY